MNPIRAMFPNAAEGREFLVQLQKKSENKVLLKDQLKNAVKQFNEAIEEYSAKKPLIAEGYLEYDFFQHNFIQLKLENALKKDNRPIAKDFFEEKIRNLANDVAKIANPDNEQINEIAQKIEQFFRKEVFKFCNAKDLEDYHSFDIEHLQAAEQLSEKLENKLLPGKMPSQDEREKETYRLKKKFVRLIKECIQIDDKLKEVLLINLKGKLDWFIPLLPKLNEKIYDQLTFAEVLELVIKKLEEKKKGNLSPDAKSATENALGCLMNINETIQQNMQLNELDLSAIDEKGHFNNKLISNFFNVSILKDFLAIKTKIEIFTKEDKKKKDLKEQYDAKKKELFELIDQCNNDHFFYIMKEINTEDNARINIRLILKLQEKANKINQEIQENPFNIPHIPPLPDPVKPDLKKPEEPAEDASIINEPIDAGEEKNIEPKQEELKPPKTIPQAIQEKVLIQPIINEPLIEKPVVVKEPNKVEQNPLENNAQPKQNPPLPVNKKIPYFQRLWKIILKPFERIGNWLKRCFHSILQRNK